MRTKQSILQLAKDNQKSLKAAHKSISEGNRVMEEFASTLDDKKEFSVNVHLGFFSMNEGIGLNPKHEDNNLLLLLGTGYYKNAWELYGDDETKIKEHFSSKGTLRRAFDEGFDEGKSFKYMALNCGSMGIPHWGDGMLVFDTEKFFEDEMVALKRNSLWGKPIPIYFDNESNPDFGKLQGDLSQKEDLCFLACLKHVDDLENFAPAELTSIILKPISNHHCDYLEIITWKELKLEETVSTIRMQKDIYRAGARFLRQKAGESLSIKEKRPFDLVKNLQDQINAYSKKGVNLELHP